MKNMLFYIIISLLMIFAMSGISAEPVHAKSTSNYRISGYGGGMGLKEKKLKVNYNGNQIKVSGYGRKYQNSGSHAKASKLKSRTYKVSSKCRVGAGGTTISYKKFLKEEGRKGSLDCFIDLHIKNNKIVYIDYGC